MSTSPITGRTFTVTIHAEEPPKVYKGFDRMFLPSEMNRVAIILREGSPDMYVLDPGRAAENEFMRYLTDCDDEGCVVVGIFNRRPGNVAGN